MRVRSIAIALLVLATGCRQLFGLDETQRKDAQVFDGPIDGSGMNVIDAPPGCFGQGHFIVCTQLASSTVALTTTQIDTDASTLCATQQPPGWIGEGQPPACFITANQITIENASAIGRRPLVLVADSIEVKGGLSVAARRGSTAPAGYDKDRCAPFTRAPISSGMNGGGGAAGTLDPDHSGGDGGDGGSAGAIGGLHAIAQKPVVLHGGCPGQVGADGDPATGGQPGIGGGAIYLVASASLRCESGGLLDASGSSGGGGGHRAGAGGAGSGGMIALWSPSIELSSGCTIMANAGGGGQGGGGGGGFAPDGGEATAPSTPASGGTGGGPGVGGDGGAGFAGTVEATNGKNGSSGSSGGGGGGGAAGIIYTNVTFDAAAAVSPRAGSLP